MFECTPIHGTRRAFKPVSVGSAKQAISIHPQPPSKRRLSPSPCLCIPLPAVKWAAGRHGRTDRAGLGVIPSGHGVNVTHTRRTEGIWTDRPPLGVRADQHGDGGELQSGSTAPGSVCSSHCSAEARDRQPPSPALPSPVLTCPSPSSLTNSDMPHAAQRDAPHFNGERAARTGRPTRPPMDGHMGALKCWVLRLLGKRTPKSTLGGPPVLDVLSGTLLG